jgi:hypothetical protein
MSPPTGGEQHSPADGCGEGVFVVVLVQALYRPTGLSVTGHEMVGITQATIHHHTERIAQKENSHVMDHHRNSNHPVAVRLFGSERNSKHPALRPVGSRSDRYRRHPRHIGPPRRNINLS